MKYSNHHREVGRAKDLSVPLCNFFLQKFNLVYSMELSYQVAVMQKY